MRRTSQKEIYDPLWPKPNQRLEASLGRFIIAWAILEQAIDNAIEDISRLDHDIAGSISANLGTKAKLDIFQSIAHCLNEVWIKASLSEMDRLVADTGNASGELRNFIVHGQPIQMMLPNSRSTLWTKFSARKGGLRGVGVKLGSKYVNDQAAVIRALVKRWTALRGKMAYDLYILSLVENSEIGKDERQVLITLHPRPPRSRPDSPPTNRKPKKHPPRSSRA